LKEKVAERFETPRERREDRAETLKEKVAERFETPRERREDRAETLKEKVAERFETSRERREDRGETLKEKVRLLPDGKSEVAGGRPLTGKGSVSILSDTLLNELMEQRPGFAAAASQISFLVKLQSMFECLPREVRTLLQSALSRCLLHSALSSESEEARQAQHECDSENAGPDMEILAREISGSGREPEDILTHLDSMWSMFDNRGILCALQALLLQRANLVRLFQLLIRAMEAAGAFDHASHLSEHPDESEPQCVDEGTGYLIEAPEDISEKERRRGGRRQKKKTADDEDGESQPPDDSESEDAELDDEEFFFPFIFSVINPFAVESHQSESSPEEEEGPAGSSPSYLLWYYMYLFYERLFSRGLPYAQFTSTYAEGPLKENAAAKESSSGGFLWFSRKSREEEPATQACPENTCHSLLTRAEQKFENEYVTLFDEDYDELSHDDLMNDPEYRELYEFINS
jgi:hypothetical protein